MQLLSSVSNLVLTPPGISRVSLSCLGESLYPSACPASALSGADTAAPCPACPAPVRPSQMLPRRMRRWRQDTCLQLLSPTSVLLGALRLQMGMRRILGSDLPRAQGLGWRGGASPLPGTSSAFWSDQAKHKCCASFCCTVPSCLLGAPGIPQLPSAELVCLPSSRMGWAGPNT